MLLQHISFQCHQQFKSRDVVDVIILYLDLQLPMQSVPITTNVVSSNPVHGEVYSIQHYVVKFINVLTAMHDIAEIFLKVAINNQPTSSN